MPKLLLFIIALLVSIAGSTGGSVQAQDAPTLHPLVGTWEAVVVLDETSGKEELYWLATFHSDYTALLIMNDGGIWLGAWEATGDRTASYRFETFADMGLGQSFGETVEVNADGNSRVFDDPELSPGEGVRRVTAPLVPIFGAPGGPIATPAS